MLLLDPVAFTLPLTNPVAKFLIILLVILFAPILLNRIKIPPLLGLIMAGALIGPNGLHLMDRDSSIILSGTAGLLYIMFLAGLEIDINEFKKNSQKSAVFGMFTFLIPMSLGIFAGIYILGFSILTSVLLASMFASHTLLAYPMVSKFGLAKNRAVNVAVGGTVITDTLALLVLAVVVGMVNGEVTNEFWLKLGISLIIFAGIIVFIFPRISVWFFKRYDDNISQFIFVLVMVFSGSLLAELAGIEAIIGAFLVGLALNKLIPNTSPLMNRIEFVGNAIFIPFFLIGVGMLIDFRAFVKDLDTIVVAVVMVVVATISKFLAAWLTQKSFRYTKDERDLIFGLSNAQAAATLAAVLVGYNIIIGENADGEPIRLLNDSVLNGTILMILVTCTIASFVAQRGVRNILINEEKDDQADEVILKERILIPVSNLETVDELVNLGVTIKTKKNKEGVYALSIIDDNTTGGNAEKQAHKVLDRAINTAAATDTILQPLLRYDLNIVNGISNVVKENKITDLILGLHIKKGISDSFLGNLTQGILSKCNATTLIYKPAQPFNTIKRYIVVIPENGEKEAGFPFWLIKIWNIAQNTGAKVVFYGAEPAFKLMKNLQEKYPIDAEYKEFTEWDDFLILAGQMQKDDNLVILMSRKSGVSFQPAMNKIPGYLNKYFQGFSFILVFPIQTIQGQANLTEAVFLEPLEKLDELGKTIVKLLKSK